MNETIEAEGNLHDVIELLANLRKNREPLLHCSVFIEARFCITDSTDYSKLKLTDYPNAEEMIEMKTYADYIATRPRAERFGSHGLFTDDGVAVKLQEVSDNIRKYEGNIWTIVISLRREDAERLGFATVAKNYGYNVSVIYLRNPTRSNGNNLLRLVNKYMELYQKKES